MKTFTFLAVLFFAFLATAQTPDDFVFVAGIDRSWDPNLTIDLTSSGPVNVDWGDGQTSSYTNNLNNFRLRHQYASSNNYSVIIEGSLDSFNFIYLNRNSIDVTQWGTSQWKSMYRAFTGCDDLFITATDIPNLSQVTSLAQMFFGAENFNSDISNWDVSNITDMSKMFQSAYNFNQPLNSWDVSNVTDMTYMFAAAANFNQPLDNWDVSSMSIIFAMFNAASSFNQPIGNWDVSNITDFRAAFSGASAFNQSLNSWDISSTTSLRDMFSGATNFNQSLNLWDVSNITNTSYMFSNASSFNQSLDNWNVSNVTTMNSMFKGATNFNQPLGSWDVSGVGQLNSIFEDASSFNQPLTYWQIGAWPMQNLFRNAVSFNQDISFWNFGSSSSSAQMIGDSFENSGLDTENYDVLLGRFVDLNLVGRTINMSGLEYCDIFTRNILLQRGWVITGDSLSGNCANNTLTGNIVYDIDNDACDNNDPVADNLAVQISSGNYFMNVFTDLGQFEAYLRPGTYNITPLLNSTLYTSIPSTISIMVSDGNTVNRDFCLILINPINDLEVSILPLQDARPGFDTEYKIIYKNKGNTRLSGSVDLIYQDDYMDFLTATPAVTTYE
jgi:surface protein